MRRYIILFTFLLIGLPLFSQKLPVLINSEEHVFLSIAERLDKELPKNIEILVYRPNLFNDVDVEGEKLVENYRLILSSQQLIRSFRLRFIEEVIEKNEKISASMIEVANEEELIGVARQLEIDAVLMANITVFRDKQRAIWDRSRRKWAKKNIALIQGNVFISDNRALIIRFAYYFLID